MSSESNNQEMLKRKLPLYLTVDGFRIPGYFSPEAFRSALAYKASPGDLFIVTYPKCGTTWVQNIVACIYRGGKPFDSYIEFLAQTPFLEMAGAEAATTMKRQGGIKTHLPFHLAPWSSEAKYIFIARNPKVNNRLSLLCWKSVLEIVAVSVKNMKFRSPFIALRLTLMDVTANTVYAIVLNA